MEFSDDIKKYLGGEKFSNGLIINIATTEIEVISRFNFIKEIVHGKNVIHLGCCDHIALIEKKIKEGTWLHAMIDSEANNCLGIDTNNEGIEFIKNKLKYDCVKCADITKPNVEEIKNKKWDYIIIGEILEHVDNPVLFLEKIKKSYGSFIHKVLITVPNAFSFYNFKASKKRIEVINSDHRYWFTPYTLGKILTNAGYNITHYYFAHEISRKIGLKSKLKIVPFFQWKLAYRRLKRIPVFRDTIIMIADFNG